MSEIEHDANRTALAMILAAERGDAQRIVELWQLAERKEPIVFALCTLPGVLIARTVEYLGATIDVEKTLEYLVRNLAEKGPKP